MSLSVYALIHGGDWYFELYEKLALPSLLQPGNLPRVRAEFGELAFCFYTRPEDQRRLAEIARRWRLAELGTVKILPERSSPQGEEAGHRLMGASAISHQIRFCLETGRRMLFTAADTAFGDGSIYRLAKLGDGNEACFAAPYVRVLDTDVLARLGPDSWPLTNAQLATLALSSLHPSWVFSQRELARNDNYHAGHSMLALGDRQYAVTERMGNVYLANYLESDLDYFRYVHDFRVWDSVWPGKLAAESRFRMIGSSELFFSIQATRIEKSNSAPLAAPSIDYTQHHLHHFMTTGFVLNLTAESPVDLAARGREQAKDPRNRREEV